MKILLHTLLWITLATGVPSIITAYTDDCEEHSFHLDDEDVADDADEPHWYNKYRQNPSDLNVDFNDPTYDLDEDAAWPGMRDDYSDTLFR